MNKRKSIRSIGNFGLLLFILLANFTCQDNPDKNKAKEKKSGETIRAFVKPPSSYHDSLHITGRVAVFYHPDSIQLEKFKTISSKAEFETTTHESFFQMRNARMVLKKFGSGVKVIEAKAVRYLVFLRAGETKTIIDLDTNPNMYGLYLFEPEKEPTVADMMNIDTFLGFYFN